MKQFLTLLVLMIASQSAFAQENNDQTIFQFKVKNIEGEDFDFSSLRGKKL